GAGAGTNDAGTQAPTGGDASGAGGQGATPGVTGGGGCDCATGANVPAAPGAVALGLWSLLTVARRRRARALRRPGGRALRRVVCGLMLAIGLAAGGRAQAAYSYRMDITLDRTRVGNSGAPTTLSNYPLLLDITSANLKTVANGGHVQNANGYDITFVGADATTCGGPSTCTFNYEIESYTATTGRVIAWVQIPALKTVSASSNQTIVVKYGDATISSPTQNATGTWDTNFKAVWHLNQSSTPAGDSTSTAASASFQGSPSPATATGLVGAGIATSGTTGSGYLDYRSATFNWTSSDTFTYEGWFNTTDSFGPLYSQRDNGAGNPVIDITVGYDGSTSNSGKMSVLVRDDTGASFVEVNGSTAINDGGWHHFAVTRTGGTIQVYVDGASIGSSTGAGASGSITTGASGNYQNIGREGNWVQSNYGTTDQRFLAATFDEFRISNTLRSADWLVTDYNTMKSPSSTYVLGGETLASCGDGTKTAGEGCDDGNFTNGDGCSSGCAIETGYSCAGTTPSVCSTVCSDSVVAGSEGCDDGNLMNGDGCSSTCTVESLYHCSGSPSVCSFAQFGYYKTITVDRTKVGTGSAPTTLGNYPVLISVTDSSLRTVANGGRVRNSNGYDIVFRGLDTTTCGGPTACTFAHEIEKYDATTGQLIAWVNVPALKTQTNTANTTFNILFGNAAISTSTAQPTSTWASGFTGVWHLNQDPTGTAPQMSDATSNGNNGTATSVTTATGLVGSGVTTDGSTSYIAVNSGTSLNTTSGGSFTYSGWVKTSDSTGGIFSLRSSTSSNVVVDVMVGRDGASTSANKLMALMRDDSNGGQADLVSTSSIADGNWHLVTVNHSGTSMQLYMDTTLVGTATVSSGSFTSTLRNIGREGRWVQDSYTTTAEEYLAATLDEFRASSTARTLDWITTDYNNQSSPSTFISYTTGAGGEVATDSHTEVALISLTATEICPGTTVAWQTGYEIDVLGFNVYRDQDGQRVLLNPTFVAAAGPAGGGGGHRYQLVDAASTEPSRAYWVEEVRFDLTSRWHGPVAPVAGAPCGAPPATAVTFGGVSGSPTPISASPGAPAAEGDSREGDSTAGCAVGGGARPSLPAALLLLLVVGAPWRGRRGHVRPSSKLPRGRWHV
ncbi:MAG TPA: LamG-like jellyroll fold domain-containing protein, partial [Polyangia bacterium]|nr:LamG-like jellyroll fold domain-containing protein [Polyangia bacterium]